MEYLEYFQHATSVQDAADLLWKFRQNAAVIAGGTDLVLDIKRGKTSPATLVNIRNLKDLSYVSVEEDSVRIGATTSIQRLLSELPEKVANIRSAAKSIGNWQIRNMATLGGNLCRASSVGDLAIVLLSLDAQVRLRSNKGERYCSMGDFFLGQRKINRKPEELVEEVSFELPRANYGEMYQKFYSSTKNNSISLITISMNLSLRERDASVRVAVGGVSDRPVRLCRFEKQFNEMGNLEGLPKALDQLQHDIHPITDKYSSSAYKNSLCNTLVRRMITDLYEGISGDARDH